MTYVTGRCKCNAKPVPSVLWHDPSPLIHHYWAAASSYILSYSGDFNWKTRSALFSKQAFTVDPNNGSDLEVPRV